MKMMKNVNSLFYQLSLTVAVVLLFASVPVLAASGTGSNIQVNGVAAGSASFQHSGLNAIIRAADGTIINYTKFNIPEGSVTQFIQPNSTARVLNRIISAYPSQINGTLSANGIVYFVNPAGVTFGNGAVVNAAKFYAAAGNLNNSDFLNHIDRFTNLSGDVINLGYISAGSVTLLGQHVANYGSIVASKGLVTMAAGNDILIKPVHGSISVKFASKKVSSKKVSDTVSASAQAGITNTGTIKAKKHISLVTGDIYSLAINNEGILKAPNIIVKADKGATKVAGTLDASGGAKPGFVETSGEQVKIAGGTTIKTESKSGATGTWLIDPIDFTIYPGSGPWSNSGIGADTLEAALDFNSVVIQTSNSGSEPGDIYVNAPVSWSYATLTLDADNNIYINSELNAGGYGNLYLKYGMGTSTGGSSNYYIHAPVNLTSTSLFKAQKGSGGALINYTVITSLGSAGSTTGTDLQGINGNLTGHYVLGANIDASATSGWNSGAGFAPIGNNTTKFNGTFDGLGHTINSLKISRSSESGVGLFGYVDSSVIKNVGLTGGSIEGKYYVGSLVGSHYKGVIANAYSTSNVSGESTVGGLIGLNGNGGNLSTIINSYATGDVTANNHGAGGLVGSNWAIIKRSYATGNVTGNSNVGGLVGEAYGSSYSELSKVINSYATGDVSAINDRAGGLVGNLGYLSEISKSFATGDVAGAIYVGGLVGYVDSSSVTNAYATGTVSGNNVVGGLAGYNDGTIATIYATGNVISSGTVGGLVGYNGGTVTNGYWDTETVASGIPGIGSGNTSGATGKTTWEMANNGLSGFASSIWGNADYRTTPYLIGVANNQVFNTNDMLSGPPVTPTNRPMLYTVVQNVDQLQSINKNLSGYYLLGNDIYAGATGSWNGGKGFEPIGDNTNAFSGTLTGMFYTIHDLYINRPSTDYVGLFGKISTGAHIYYVTLNNGSIKGNYYVGSLAGYNGYGTIKYSNTSVNVSGDFFVGGLVGNDFHGFIYDSHTTGNVSGEGSVGGLIGSVNNSDIYYSSTTGDVNITTNSIVITNVGGLIGRSSSSTIANSNASGNVIATDNSNGATINVGGLVGYSNSSSIIYSGFSGTVHGQGGNNSFIITGGLVGENNGGMIINSYATGAVSNSGDYTGGLVGYNNGGTIEQDYATGAVNGNSFVGGLVGYNVSGTIKQSYATGAVSNSGDYTGGLVGTNSGTIKQSYATGAVSGNSVVGGLVGYNNGGTIEQDYATGAVNGNSSVGGLVGADYSGTINYGYWDTETTGQSTSDGSPNSHGLTTAQLIASLPTGFNSTVWANGNNKTTPYLLSLAGNQVFNVNDLPPAPITPTNRPALYTVVQNAVQLQIINNDLSGLYVLGNNIDASGTSTWNGGKGFNTIGDANSAFTGVFDGLGYTINNLVINRPAENKVGLFGKIDSGSVVRNVNLVGGSVTGGNNTGGLVGWSYHGIIKNSSTTGTVSGYDYVGGLVGKSDSNTLIKNSSASGDVSGNNFVGGLAGYNYYSTIQDSHAIGQVTGTNEYVGGLVGRNDNSTILNSYAEGNVSGHKFIGGLAGLSYQGSQGTIEYSYATGDASGDDYVGGLVGWNFTGVIKHSSATGSADGVNNVGGLTGKNDYNSLIQYSYYSAGVVTGKNFVGGLVGYNYYGTIKDSHATGRVDGSSSYVGGLVGRNDNAPIIDSYATGDVSGDNYVGGLAGLNYQGSQGTIENSYATGNVTANNNYAGGLVGWNFTGIIKRSYATGTVAGVDFVGGLVGQNDYNSLIKNSYARGAVTGNDYVGGLVGYNFYGDIVNTYAVGAINGSGSGVGALVGKNDNGAITASYWNTQTAGVGIGIDNNSQGANVHGRTTAQLKQISTYSSWDISTAINASYIWYINNGNDYPVLQAFLP